MTERTKTKATANPGGPTDAGMFTALADQLAETLSADRAA